MFLVHKALNNDAATLYFKNVERGKQRKKNSLGTEDATLMS